MNKRDTLARLVEDARALADERGFPDATIINGLCNALATARRETLEEAEKKIATGLNVHRWIDLWRTGGRQVDTATAIGFYHQALQDARDELRALLSQSVEVGPTSSGNGGVGA